MKAPRIRYTKEVIQKPFIDGNFKFEISDQPTYDFELNPTKKISFDWCVESEQAINQVEKSDEVLELFAEQVKQDFLKFLKERSKSWGCMKMSDIKNCYEKTIDPSKYGEIKIENLDINAGYILTPFRIVFDNNPIPDPEYDNFMKEYHEKHEVCPRCGDKLHSVGLWPYFWYRDKKNEYKDMNPCECCNCGDKHIVHDRISKYQWGVYQFIKKYPKAVSTGNVDCISYSMVINLDSIYNLHPTSFPEYKNIMRDFRSMINNDI